MEKLLSLAFWFLGLFSRKKQEAHDAKVQELGSLQQGNVNLDAALQAQKKIMEADAQAPKTEAELDKKLMDGEV